MAVVKRTTRRPTTNSWSGDRWFLRWGALLVLALVAAYHYNNTEYTTVLWEEGSTRSRAETATAYRAATVEDYLIQNSVALHYDQPRAPGCDVWRYPNATGSRSTLYTTLHTFLDELERYDAAVQAFPPLGYDVRHRIQDHNNNQDVVCAALQLHPQGLPGLFPSGQLSLSTDQGWVEPLLTPCRHPRWCLPDHKNLTTKNQRNNKPYLLHLGYLVHDFARLCRNLKPTSRTVLIDMGASLEFGYHEDVTPALYLTDTYAKFGIMFDHIYAYEITKIEPEHVFAKVPEHLFPAYHWINLGVNVDPTHRMNPWKLLRDSHFTKDDLIVVKLDVDAAKVEFPIVDQLLADPELLQLVDQFYFEDHVDLDVFWPYKRNLSDSLQLMHQLRQNGVAAHYWV